MIVLMLSDLPVLVTEPSVGQSATARVGARALGFVWHPVPPGHGKEPPQFAKAHVLFVQPNPIKGQG